MPGLTGIVLTLDEAPRIERCLRSLAMVADELLVVDSGSRDPTIDLARAAGATVLEQPWPGRAAQSNWAAAHVRTEWFLHLDADELVSPELAREIRAFLATAPTVDGAWLRRREQFMGRWIRCGAHRGILRLCRTAAAQMPPRRAHAVWNVPGDTVRLRHPLLHVIDQPLAEVAGKLVQRSLLSALDYADAGRRSSAGAIAWHTAATFMRMMLLKGGVCDGVPGLIWSTLRSSYCFCRMACLYELQRHRDAS